MSQDIVADGLNKIMSSQEAGREELVIVRYSNLLISILEIGKKKGYIEDWERLDDKKLKVKIGKMNKCQAIKPRFHVNKNNIESYIRRYLPSRNFGVLIISTSSGLMTHEEALEKNLGGSLIAYIY
jgi:ribosomal protein S8